MGLGEMLERDIHLLLSEYSDDQPRDEAGMWTAAGFAYTPNPNSPNQVRNPIKDATDKEIDEFDIAGQKWIKQQEALGNDPSEMLDSGKGLKLEMVDPKKCISGQEWVHKDVRSHVSDRPPVLTEHNGKYMVDDGNHRVAAALLNKRKIKAYVAHFPK